MNRIKITSLYSGSAGNATLVKTERATILIDAGKSARALCNALRQAGSDPEHIDAVFITHEHTDHISALEVFLKKHSAPVHITCVSADLISPARFPNLCKNLVTHPPLFTERVGDLTVRSFLLSHDSAMCVGYRVETDFGYAFGHATDTGYVTDGMRDCLNGCTSVLLESNHDIDMLRFGAYPPDLKKRILSRHGHLSNDDCAAFAVGLAENGTENFMLAHLSEENNTPDYAIRTVGKALSPFEKARLFVASQAEERVLDEYAEN